MPATERHKAIAEIANKLRQDDLERRGINPDAVTPYTGDDVQIIFTAWQAEYAARRAAGQIANGARNRWRNPIPAERPA